MITDAGLAHLRHLPALRELDLSADEVTEAGVKQLGGLPALRVVHLHKTRCDAVDIVAIEAANPKWTVWSACAALAPKPAREVVAKQDATATR